VAALAYWFVVEVFVTVIEIAAVVAHGFTIAAAARTIDRRVA